MEGRELKDHPHSFNPPQQHLYNGLARPVDYSISALEWTRPPVSESTLEQE